MKRIIYFILLIPFISFGQTKDIPKEVFGNSRASSRINEDIRKGNAHAITIAQHTDSVAQHRDELDNHTDSIAKHRTELDNHTDSVALIKTVFDWGDSTTVLTEAVIDSATLDAVRYSNTYWDDIRVALSNTRLSPTKSEPALEEIVTGALSYAFEADADSTERLNFELQLPHDRKAGSDLEAHLHWSPSTTHTGNCYWRFTYTIISINGTFGPVTSLRVLDAGDGTANKHQLIEFGWIEGENLGLSSVLIGNVTRLGEHPSDSFTGVAYGLSFDLHYERDNPGSQSEVLKY